MNMNDSNPPLAPHVNAHPASAHPNPGSGGAINDSEPLHAITTRAIQQPMSSLEIGRLVPAVMSVLEKSDILARLGSPIGAKPSTPPPQPQITEPLKAIALGFEMGFKQLASPTPYGNHITAYKIYRNKTANSFSGATLWETRPHDNALGQQAVTVQDSSAGANKSWFFFVTSVDSFGQESAPGSFQASAVTSLNANPNVANAVGSGSTSSLSLVVISGMTITISTHGNSVLITTTVSASCSVAGGSLSIKIYKDGSPLSGLFSNTAGVAGTVVSVAATYIDSPTAGSHTYDVRWDTTSGNTLTLVAGAVQAVELG